MAEHDDQGDGQKPLHGVVLCSTALGQDIRTRVANYAVDLGATHLLDLTKDVTHLIVGSVKTPKYQFVAKHRPDVKVLGLEWIEEIRSQWIEGEDVDVDSLEAKHRYPIFAGLSICITGFVHLEDRSRFEQLFTSNGAKYSGDLSKQISHLIVAAPEGAKYTHAKQWGIPCVTARWVTDCMTRGMTLDESLYDPLLPEDQQGRGAFVLSTTAEHVLKRRSRDDDESQSNVAHLGNKRKFRRTASSRLETHSQDLWQNISARNSAHDDSLVDQWNDEANADSRTTVNHPPSNNAMREADSNDTTVESAAKLFEGWRISLYRFEQDKKRKLQQVLQDQCGAITTVKASEIHAAAADPQLKACILVPHMPDFPADELPSLPQDTVLATEWWIERCILNKSIVPTDQDRLSRPFWPTCTSSFSTLNITSSGLSSLDLRQIVAVIKLQGATYQESLTPSTSIMIGVKGQVKKEKAYYAAKHKIPLVNVQWLWACIDSHKQVDFEPYLIATDSIGQEVDSAARTDSRKAATHAQQPPSISSLSNSHTPNELTSKRRRPRDGPFVQDDDSDTGEYQASLGAQTSYSVLNKVLSNRSPNASPKKHAAKSEKAVLLSADKPELAAPRNAHVFEPGSRSRYASPSTTKPSEDLSTSLASLSNQLLQSRREPSTSAISQQRRRTKKLGRAASGILHRSTSIVSTDTSHDDHRLDLFHDEASEHEVATAEQNAPSGTQLGYEVPDAEDHRREMAKKMGLTLADDTGGRKVASLGTVKDSEQVSAYGIVRNRRTRAGR